MGIRVLLCDDEPPILRAAEFKMKRAGYEVQCAGDGQQAWDLIQRWIPDVLVTDCQMPRMGGEELCRLVRENEPTRELPIIMLTAKGFEFSDERRKELGIDRLMTKPFSPRELLEGVDALFTQRADSAAPSSMAEVGTSGEAT